MLKCKNMKYENKMLQIELFLIYFLKSFFTKINKISF